MSFNSLSDLRNSRGNFNSLMKEVEKMSTTTTTQSRDDGREWKPTVDQAGNGYAVIRFLPAPKGEDFPWARIWNHGFQGSTGKWYIENSLTTLGQQDPVSELNTELWNSGVDSDKEIARKQKRRLAYYANIVVVKDASNPANEGQVFLYKFGKKIFDKIMDVMQPQFQDEDPVNPYDFWEGADFKIKIRKVEGWVNYDKSEFGNQSALFNSDEEKLEEVYAKVHSLADFTKAENYKTYAELKAKFNKVLGVDAGHAAVAEPAVAQTLAEPTYTEAPAGAAQTAEAEDDTLSYFAKLAQES